VIAAGIRRLPRGRSKQSFCQTAYQRGPNVLYEPSGPSYLTVYRL